MKSLVIAPGQVKKPEMTFKRPCSYKGVVSGPLPKYIRDHVVAAGTRDPKHLRSLEEVILRRRLDNSKDANILQNMRERLAEERDYSYGGELKQEPDSLPNSVKRVLGQAPRIIPTAAQWRSQEESRKQEEKSNQGVSKDQNDAKSHGKKRRRRKHSSSTSKLRLKSELSKVLERLEVLEAIHKQNLGSTALANIQRGAAGSGGTRGADIEAVSSAVEILQNCDLEKEEMIQVMDDIQNTLQCLDQNFSTDEQNAILELEQASAAVTIIAKYVRAHTQRKRYVQARAIMRRFKRRNGGSLVGGVAQHFFQTRQRKLNSIHSFCIKRDDKIKMEHFSALRSLAAATRPERKRIAAGCASLRATLHRALLELIVQNWARVAQGPHSRRAVAERFKTRFDIAREELVKENKQRPEAQQVKISREDVLEYMGNQAVAMMQRRRSFHVRRIFFKSWATDYMFQFWQKKKRADNFFLASKFPRFFNAWRNYVAIVQSEARIAYVYDPKRFDASHNDQVVRNFARRILAGKAMKGWRAITAQNKAVRDRVKSVLQRKLRGAFQAWKIRADFQRQVKMVCITEWKELQVRRRRTPFRAWYVYAQSMRKKREAQQTLLAAFERRKKRLLVARMFKLWSHKAIYGKTGGMHSRAELIKALETQKQMVLAMQVSAVQQKESIAQLEDALVQQKERTSEQQIKLAERDEDIIKIKCAQQQLETEVVRVQSLFDSISLIHPGTAKRLLAAEASRSDGFKDKGITQVARRAGQKAKMVSGASSDDALASKGGSGSGTSPSGPCVKCGYDQADASIRPQSARMPLKPPGPNDPIKLEEPRVGSLTSDNVVWVTGRDSGIIMRTHWAQSKLAKMARKAALEEEEALRELNKAQTPSGANNGIEEKEREEEKGSERSGNPEDHSSEKLQVEIKNLQSILAFLFSGNKDDLSYFEANLTPRLENRSGQVQSELCVEQLQKAKLHVPSNWNDFLQGVSKHFPLLHPANDDPKKAIARRITTQKHNVQQNILRGLDRKRQNVYKGI